MEGGAVWDHHVHTWVSDYLEDKKEVRGEPVAEEAHEAGLPDVFEARSELTDRYAVSLAEHDGRVENDVYLEELEDRGYRTDNHGTHISAEMDGNRYLAIVGAQVNARDERGIQKDVVATGIDEDFDIKAKTPQELYEEAAQESELLFPTHANVMRDWLWPLKTLDIKNMTNSDIEEVLQAGEEYDTPAGIALPSFYSVNAHSRYRTVYGSLRNYFQGVEAFPAVPRINELDLHGIEDLEALPTDRPLATNLVPEEVFDRLWEGEGSYEKLLDSAEPTEIPSVDREEVGRRLSGLKNRALYRIPPALRGWGPETAGEKSGPETGQTASA
ncbi:MAG: hypothetical protein SVS85_03115 [Candidatus Nanohaloarchaea archaeon]|nr:hypothetical protein [Candidatus Nanohaloarchaea archaeon]